MSSKTKIVVLHMKEVVYSVLLLVLAVVLGIVVFFMFGSGNGKAETASGTQAEKYTPGVYRSAIQLNDNSFDVEVTVDSQAVTSIGLANLSESTKASYPLMEPALDTLAEQICETQSLENLTYSDDQKYTSQMLLSAIRDALAKAEAE